MSRKILGLDIRSDAVSAVLLTNSSKGTAIKAYEYVPISGSTDFESDLAATLKSVVEKIDVTNAVVVASFPAEQISYRNIQVPFKESKTIRQILPYELEPTLPQAVEDLIIDFQTLTLPDKIEHTDLIAAAVAKTELKAYLDILASFEIEPEIVTVGGYPTAFCLNRLAETPENYLGVDIGSRRGTVFAVLSGEVCLIRSFPIRSDNSLSVGESLGTDIQRTLSALKEMLCLDFQPESVFVTGCGRDDPGLAEDMARILRLPVRQTDLTASIQALQLFQPEQPWNTSQMDNALALALMEAEGISGLNFRQGPFAAKKFWIEHKQSLIKTGIVAGLVLILAFFNVVLESHLANKKLAGLNRQITAIFTSTFPDVKKIVDPYQQMQVKMQSARKNTFIPLSGGKMIRSIDLLNDISRLIPSKADVNLTRLVMGPESIAISGDTDTFNAVDDIKSRLEQSEFFKKISISSANIDRSDNRVRFKLKVNL